MFKKLFQIGILAGDDALPVLNRLSENEKKLLLERLERMENKPVILNRPLVEKLISRPKIIKTFIWKKTYSMQDMIVAYSERYRILQNIISKKIENPVSISNCSGDCSIIGMVREKKDNKLVLEDPSGSINVVNKEVFESSLLDDVIGLKGRRQGNDFFPYKIYYPDIPLRNAVLIPCDLVFSNGIFEIEGEKIECENCFLDIISVQILSVDIDLSELERKLRLTELEVALELLKRRHLNNPPDDVISIVPDIFILKTKNHFVYNYKGTTLIGVPEGKRIRIDLSTREVEEL